MRYFIYILCFSFFVLFTSCDNRDDLQNRGNVHLNVMCKNLTSRATANGVDAYNENKINRLDCFIYTADAGFDDEAVFYAREIVDINATGIVSLDFTSDDLEDIFGKFDEINRTYPRSQCLIYLIANLPNNIVLSGNETVNELKSKTIEANFLTLDAQSEFVMDSKGDDVVTLVVNEDNSCDLTANVILYRAASKVALNITSVVNQVTVGEDTYYSQPKSMRVYMHYGVSKSNVDNNISPYTIAEDDYFDFSADFSVGYKTSYNSNNEVIGYEQNVPFYSYPTDWNNSDKEVYLTLVVPWRKNNESEYRSCYYQIPVNSLGKNLLRNSFYKINLSVGILGSFEKNTAITVNPSYTILDIEDWNEVDNSVVMQNYRYLMVQENDHTLHNIEELFIPYVTSNECEIVDIKFEKYDVSGVDAGGVWRSSTKSFTLRLDENNNIYFYNSLDNYYASKTFDFTPYRLSFAIHHKDNDNYREEISILQYPAIYADAFTNSDYNNGGTINGNYGYMFVNGYTSSSDTRHNNLVNQDFFCSAPGLTNDGASPNMYVFTITSVQGLDYVIGDPRTNEIDTELRDAKRKYRNASTTATAWQQAPALYDGANNRGLRYYYPTDVDYTSGTTMQNSRTRNMVAPKFRIASAYAVLHTNVDAAKNIDGLRKRCASYQEDGYPAGRWRLPTEAEFKFILSQVNKNPSTLPQMYIKGYSYWCAHGVGTVQSDGSVSMNYTTKVTTSDGHSARCVYDEWYWGSEQIDSKNVFTWGDMPR